MYFKKEKTKKNIIALTAVLCAFIVFGSLVSATTPNNIIVASVNYVDQKIDQLTQKINQLEARIGSSSGTSTGGSYNPTNPTMPSNAVERLDKLEKAVDLLKNRLNNHDLLMVNLSEASQYKVIVLEKGQKLMAGGVVELIVRSGICTAIQGDNGDGIADMTSGDGKDYYTGDKLPINHYLLISRGDGRGVTAVSDAVYLMVKGSYSIYLP